jgi:hypothetical protein
MFMDSVQTVIHRQQSTKKASETIRTAMADTQFDADVVTAQKSPSQLHAVSIGIQMSEMQVTCNPKSTSRRALQQMQEHELLSSHSLQMQMLRFGAISSPIQM